MFREGVFYNKLSLVVWLELLPTVRTRQNRRAECRAKDKKSSNELRKETYTSGVISSWSGGFTTCFEFWVPRKRVFTWTHSKGSTSFRRACQTTMQAQQCVEARLQIPRTAFQCEIHESRCLGRLRNFPETPHGRLESRHKTLLQELTEQWKQLHLYTEPALVNGWVIFYEKWMKTITNFYTMAVLRKQRKF